MLSGMHLSLFGLDKCGLLNKKYYAESCSINGLQLQTIKQLW